MPHNFQTEVFDADLFNYAIQLTHDLDRSFNLPPKRVMSQRDVPGLTRAAVPLLAAGGVAGLSVGVNGGSSPPAVPHYTPFIWRDEGTNTSVIAFWHPGGYSGWPVDTAPECITAPGLDHVLCAAWHSDNQGPHSVEEILDIYNRTRTSFPEANVVASTLDDFLGNVSAALATGRVTLPVVTEEIGDSWIHGIASDPAKLSEYRSLLRMRRASRDRWGDDDFNRFSRLLVKIPEHTWGVDTKEDPGDYTRWSNVELRKALEEGDEKFVAAVDSWRRQRSYCQWAAEELKSARVDGSDVKNENTKYALYSEYLRAEFVVHQPTSLMSAAAADDQVIEFSSHSWDIGIDPKTGVLVKLQHKTTTTTKNNIKKDWVGGGHMAKLVYTTYDESSYDAIWDHYAYSRSPFPDWFLRDFGKPNCTKLGGAMRREVGTRLKNVYTKSKDVSTDIGTDKGLFVVLEMEFDDDEVVEVAGAPSTIYLELSSPGDGTTTTNPRELFIDVIWENKTATRLPEAMWLSFEPDPQEAVDPGSWEMSKLGQWISPLEVAVNGSRSMHGVDDDGVRVGSGGGEEGDEKLQLQIRTLDAGLVSPGKKTPFPTVHELPDMEAGMHFNLINNIWGTNYVMWFPYDASDANMRFRFVVKAGTKDGAVLGRGSAGGWEDETPSISTSTITGGGGGLKEGSLVDIY